MINHKSLFVQVASAAFFFACMPASAQWQVPDNAVPIGRGAGFTGFKNVPLPSGSLLIGQSGIPQAIIPTGDVTITAAGVTAIGATKVTSAMLNSNVYSTAHSWGGQQTFVAPILGTPASGVATNLTGLPISTGVSGLGTGIAAALAVNTGSAGAPVLFNGALGTPSSGTATNLTGLPVTTGISGLGTSVAASLAVNVGTAGALVVNGGVLGTPSSGTATNLTGLPISTGVSGLGTNVAAFLATPSSANLRAALTDEVGTGAAYFVGGALGTPASGVATNLTGLPLTTGVTGILPKANGGLGAATLSSALDTEFSSTQGAIIYRNATAWVALPPGTAGQFFTTQGAAANPNWSSGGAGTGTVTSVTLGSGYGVSVSGTNPITASGTFTPAVGLTSLTNSLSADVALNNTGNYFTGPQVAQGTSVTWYCSGSVTIVDGTGSAAFNIKLWDGTTAMASLQLNTFAGGALGSFAISGLITSPAGNIRISVQDLSSTNGFMRWNNTGNSKDSTLTCVRIA